MSNIVETPVPPEVVPPVTVAINKDSIDFYPPNSSNQWPVLKELWTFFAGNAGNIHILTVNSSSEVLADLKLAEKVGGKLTVCTNELNKTRWEDIQCILKDRNKSPLLTNPEYTAYSKCWVLSNRVSIHQGIPCVYDGSISLTEEESIPLVKIDSLTTNSYYDIVKIDFPGLERFVLNNLYEYGMRPALLMVRWSGDPDVDLNIHSAAATLVNHGYTCVARVDDKYLYHYNDKPFYNLCQYSVPSEKNPMIDVAVKHTKATIHKHLGKLFGLV